jgi:hypothetical protein
MIDGLFNDVECNQYNDDQNPNQGGQSYLFFYTLLVVGDCWCCFACGANANNDKDCLRGIA